MHKETQEYIVVATSIIIPLLFFFLTVTVIGESVRSYKMEACPILEYTNGTIEHTCGRTYSPTKEK